MKKLLILGLAMIMAASVSFSASTLWPFSDKPKEYTVIDWDDLIPEGAYDFFKDFKIGDDPETDSELAAALEFAQRGTVEKLNNTNATIIGFMIPLDLEAETVTDFMIVPYAAACYHVPPPQPNQTIFASSKVPLTLQSLYDPIVVKGELKLQEGKNDLAESTYYMQVDSLENEEF